MNQKGVKSVFLIAPNYAAGKDVLAGVKANYKGNVVGEEYTRWPDQLDFSAELTKARTTKPDAVFAFYPGAAGVQFMTQYAQAGLKGQIPLYTCIYHRRTITTPPERPRGRRAERAALGARPSQRSQQNLRQGLRDQALPHTVVLRLASLRRDQPHRERGQRGEG
jgi:ABC-type branched-subunit amino acid transport system substrate-binding protein